MYFSMSMSIRSLIEYQKEIFFKSLPLKKRYGVIDEFRYMWE